LQHGLTTLPIPENPNGGLIFELVSSKAHSHQHCQEGACELVIPETIGERLRLAREERGVPLREVADQTRISIHYLEAIEANEFSRLPGGIFNRSFLKAYARYVKVDEKEALEGYTRLMRAQGDTGEDVASTPYHPKVYTDTPATRSPVLTVVLAIVILAILTAGALALLKWYQRRSAELRPGPYSEVATAASPPSVR
jgi:cytoskeletal protein RodZ